MNEIYQSSDFGLVVYLSLFYPITGKESLSGNRVIFSFEQTQELLDDVQKYYNKQTNVDALTYKNQMANVKSQIYNNY